MMKTPREITAATLDCLVMPNGEIICAGRTIGWVDKLGKYLSVKKESKVQCRQCGAIYKHGDGCPNDCNDESYG